MDTNKEKNTVLFIRDLKINKVFLKKKKKEEVNVTNLIY